MSQMPASNDHPDDAHVHRADTLPDSIAALLDQAIIETRNLPVLTGLMEARNQFDALNTYLSEGDNPMPSPWSHSIGWRDPQHSPSVEKELNAALAHPDTIDQPTPAVIEHEDGQFGMDFDSIPDTQDEANSLTVSVLHADQDPLFGRNNPIKVVAPVVPESLLRPPAVPQPAPTVVAVPTFVPPTTSRASIPAASVYGEPGAGTPLLDVKKFVRAKLDEGLRCPACDQFAKRYRRQINGTIAKRLISLYVLADPNVGGWIHTSSVLNDKGDVSKARHWSLIEEEKDVVENGRSGYWRLTAEGIRYVTKSLMVNKYAVVYDGLTEDLEGPMLGIESALGKKFDYNALMSA